MMSEVDGQGGASDSPAGLDKANRLLKSLVSDLATATLLLEYSFLENSDTKSDQQILQTYGKQWLHELIDRDMDNHIMDYAQFMGVEISRYEIKEFLYHVISFNKAANAEDREEILALMTDITMLDLDNSARLENLSRQLGHLENK